MKRELKILRRPASVTILDDGTLLAVLSSDHQVDLYNLSEKHPKHVRAIALDHAPRTIALSPTGSVLAAAYDGGVEVYSLASAAVVADRRAVKCDPADSLSFSEDGTQLLGTTLNSKNPSTVILTAPYYDPGDFLPEDTVSHLWTTSIIFPNSSRDCSHAVLLPSPHDDESSWTFTYDRVFETFRAVRIDDLRNGTTYFTGPTPDVALFGKLLPSTLPTATASGEVVAAGFQGKEIWLYGVPDNLDSSPDLTQSPSNAISNLDVDITPANGMVGRVPSLRNSHTWPRDPNSSRIPQWQLLCDKSRNTFVEGRKISLLGGISALKWITGKQSADIQSMSCSERLIAVAPGVVSQKLETDEDGMAPVDGGRISFLDFNYLPSGGKQTFLTIEVGNSEPEVLEEEHRDLEAEVAIVRRRTVAQRRGNRTEILRSATTATRTPPTPAATSSTLAGAPAVPPVPPLPVVERTRLPGTDERPETSSLASFDEEQEALDAPYAHGAPRSGTTLRRAATAAAINRRLHPQRVPALPVAYRRADGREEHPHESDADNWVPPPPPYSREPVAPLPEHLKNAVLAGSVPNLQSNNLHRSSTQRSSSSTDSNILSSLQRSRTTYLPPTDVGRSTRYSPRRTVSESTIQSSSSDSFDEAHRPTAQEVERDFDPLYDVSPPGTPPQQAVQPSPSVAVIPPVPILPAPVNQIPRRPVGLSLALPASSSRPISSSSMLQPVSPLYPPTSSSTSGPSAQDPVMLQPVSPLYQPSALNISPIPENSVLEKLEGAAEAGPDPGSRPSTGSASLTQFRLDAPVPPRPNEDHRMTELPPTVPQQQPGMEDIEQLSPPQLETPLAISVPNGAERPQPGLDLPSASQLARLNSRSGRPHALSDPSRRGSGTYPQPQYGSPNRQNTPPRRVPVPNLPPHGNSPGSRNYPPPQPQYAYSSPSHSPVHNYSPSHNPSHRNNNQILPRQPSTSAQHLSPRPRMQRLETIHSITSDSGPPTGPMKPQGVFRKASRAERSAAINIQQAKERGWRGTVKRDKRKKKDKDGSSSAGWTDVSKESRAEDNKKGTKCVVM